MHPSVPAGSSKPTDADLWLGYDDYYRLIERLCLKVYDSGWKFDQILCLARGGMRVGDVISRVFDLPLAILSTSSYREDSGTSRGELDIAKYVTISRGTFGGRVLLADDLVDSGVTLHKVSEHLKRQFPAVTEVRTAVIWWKGSSTFEPDYFVDHLPNNPWIHQPFEDYDSLRPQQLEAWIRRGTS